MRWNLISSILTDTRILILLTILIIFLIIAVAIVILEFKLKTKTKKKFTEEVENVRLTALKNELKKAASPTQKLVIIDKQAKSLFKERFSISSKKSYSELIEVFNQKKKYNYSSFCEKMFEGYYSEEGITEEKLKNLLIYLTRLIRERNTYVDPEKYSLKNLYPSTEKDPEHKITHSKSTKLEKQRLAKLDKRKEQLSKKQQALIEKQMLLTTKQKEITQKEKTMKKQEKTNENILRQVEEKLEQQEVRLKQQERLQQKISKELEKEELQKRKIESAIKEKKMLEQKIKQEEAKKYWRDTIDVNAPKGKEWLKAHKKRIKP